MFMNIKKHKNSLDCYDLPYVIKCNVPRFVFFPPILETSTVAIYTIDAFEQCILNYPFNKDEHFKLALSRSIIVYALCENSAGNQYDGETSSQFLLHIDLHKDY